VRVHEPDNLLQELRAKHGIYYARRKGLALPVWATPDEARMILGNPDAAMGGLKVAVVVDCRAGIGKISPPTGFGDHRIHEQRDPSVDPVV
jgi:hypothetical protein